MKGTNMTGSDRGFTLVQVLLIAVLVGILGFTGWYVYSAQQNVDKTLKADNSETPSFKKKAGSATGDATDPTAGWKSYTSATGRYSLKYPAN